MIIPNLEDVPLFTKLRYLPFITFLFVGIGLLWPWNNILSATLYFQNNLFQSTTVYAKFFTSSMMTTSTITSLIFNLYLSKRQHSYNQRVTRGLFWQILTFLILTLLSYIVTLIKHIPVGLIFLLVMILVGMSTVATALTQNGIMAIANVFGPQFSQSVMLGQAVAGVLPSTVLFFVTLIKNDNQVINDSDTETMNTSGVLFYFMTTVVVCNKNGINVSRDGLVDQGNNLLNYNEAVREQDNNIHNRMSTIPLGVLYRKLKYLLLSIFFTFVVTLIFPIFASTIKVNKLPLDNTQFVPLVFTVWNIGDLYGRVLADLPTFKDSRITPRVIFTYSLSRTLCIPLFLYFTVKNQKPINKLLWLDLTYILLQFLFGVTNGHVISLSFMKVPEQLDTNEEKEAAGGLTSVFVSIGLAAGSLVSYVFVAIIGKLG
ncbi:hypothetical protein RI543_003613 [Arxiozyma heterogenica]|uniref:Nucleoside transporter FUN26 n=1 Tax=Arxiozyma heterogenica TaxID=278026 RepID=A0AAN7WSF9_9SACH|nr:hypothetical protein RI543_003613 [Kazachstania heterogenica]